MTMNFGTWNVRSLYRDGDARVLSRTLSRYGMDVVALQEIRWIGTGEIKCEEYTIFYSCNESRHIFGTGFAVHNRVLSLVVGFEAINERMCVLRLRGKLFNYSLVNVHAPTEDKDIDEKDEFYGVLEDVYGRLPRHDVGIVLGDLNAKVGREETLRPNVGHYSLHERCNDNGSRLASFAISKNLIIASTIFRHKDIHKGTWKSPDGRTTNQIDHSLVDKRHIRSVQDCRVFRGADCDSDHFLVALRVRMRINIEQRHGRAQGGQVRYDSERFGNQQTCEVFGGEVSARIPDLPSIARMDIGEAWGQIREAVRESADEVIGLRRRPRGKPWFDEECVAAIERRETARRMVFQCPRDVVLEAEYDYIRRETRRLLKSKKKCHLQSLVKELEIDSRQHNSRNFFQRVKSWRKGFQPRTNIISDENGQLMADSVRVVARWGQYFRGLLNEDHPSADSTPPTLPHDMTLVPTISLEELRRSLKSLKNNRAPGSDNIPGEFYKRGGALLEKAIFEILKRVWDGEVMPDDWGEGLIVPIHKKGDRKVCSNYRGITLTNSIYKIFSSILLARLTPFAEDIVGEYQCGFRRNRSTIDQLFSLRQILEKRWEHNCDTHCLFIDFQRAYDSVNRERLYETMLSFGIPAKLVRLTAMCLWGSSARVRIGGCLSESFRIGVGLKQGDALSPLLFNLVLERVVRSVNSVHGGLSLVGARLLGYADDVALLGGTGEDIQSLCAPLISAARDVGLRINAEKTEYLPVCRVVRVIDDLYVRDYKFKNVKNFRYLGSQINRENIMREEILARMGVGSRALFSLRTIFRSRELSITAKIKVWNSIIRPTVVYGCETWSLTIRDMQRLLVFENRVLRTILGTIYDEDRGYYRQRTNIEIRQITRQPLITSFIKARRLQWAGHVVRAPRDRTISEVFHENIRTSRPLGRPRMRWIDGVRRDALVLGVADWQREALDRVRWREVIEAAVGLLAL